MDTDDKIRLANAGRDGVSPPLAAKGCRYKSMPRASPVLLAALGNLHSIPRYPLLSCQSLRPASIEQSFVHVHVHATDAAGPAGSAGQADQTRLSASFSAQ
ncbi:hypothetical protein BaRGS_00001478 [Batillaria attramentaria]|uniref:Uncharacterized protein n=1 Tax=Batillaria attramentaria TaxID=370345 RepID=A0ABD0M8H1_9CAEN